VNRAASLQDYLIELTGWKNLNRLMALEGVERTKAGQRKIDVVDPYATWTRRSGLGTSAE